MAMKNIFKLGLVALALTMPLGCSSNTIRPEPKRENYSSYSAGLARDQYLRVVDEDKDGEADLIGEMGHAKFIALGHKSQNFYAGQAKVMSPEMRRAATKELQAERELLYLMDKANFDDYKSRHPEVR